MSTVKKKLNEIAELITTEKAFYWLIMITMISLPLFELLTEQHERNFEGQPIIVEAAGIMGVVMVVARLMRQKGPQAKFYLTDVIFFLLVVFSGLSLAFSESMLNSVRGYDYDEWLTHFMAYFSLMYAGTMIEDKKLRKNILKAFIFVLLIHGIIGILQSFGYEFTNCFFDGEDVTRNKWTYGLTAHFNWFSALMTLAGGCAMGLAIFAQNMKRFLLFTGLTAIAFYTMLSNEARLSLMSIAVLIIFYPVALMIYQLKNKDKPFFKISMLRWLGILVMTAAVFSLCYFAFDRFNGELDNTLNELDGSAVFGYDPSADVFSDESNDVGNNDSATEKEMKGLLDNTEDNYPLNGLPMSERYTAFDNFATGRGHIWKYGLACVPGHWAFGVGLDNYRWCFSHAPDLPHDTWSQGKGHNELIHYLVTQGVFQLLTILTLVIYTFVIGIRTTLNAEDKEERIIEFILVGMFTAYFAQSMFNSSVVNIAPYYWITVGVCLTHKNQRPLGYRKSLRGTEKENETSADT